MALTPTSLLTCLISSALFTVLTWMLLKLDVTLKTVGRYICIFLAIIVVRMLLPVEFGFTVTLPSRYVLTELKDLLLCEVSFGAYDVAIGEALDFLWGAGIVGALTIRVVQYLGFSDMLKRCTGYFLHDIGTIIGRINEDYGKAKHFQVLLVPEMRTPAIYGLVRPKILMPDNHYTERELNFILRHEMLHYYCRDMLAKILCEILCIIYWWNPVVYLLRKIIARVIEINVDCRLTAGFSNDEKIEYMECIVKSMKEGLRPRTGLMIMLASQEGSAMKQRFRCIWDNHWLDKGRKGIFIALSSCLLFLASVSFIVEADYGSDIPGTFGYPNVETSYLVEKDGGYELYIEGELIGFVREITEPLTELKIYQEKENFTNEE